MSRFRNFSRNLVAGYFQMAVTVLYSLVSVPLILHWLPRAEFGMWAVLVQLMSYVYLIDLGINQAIARFLIDHKDDRASGQYGSLIKASFYVSVVQGLIILVVIGLGAPLLATLMNIPPEHREVFIHLLRIQGTFSAFTFCTNPLGIMLNAHQRTDLVSRQSVINMVLQFGLLVLFLYKGHGIYSFINSLAVSSLITPVWCYLYCRKLGFFPRKNEWGTVSWTQFKAVFAYSKDVFLMNLGIYLISASQTIVVSCALGLELAAAWTVGTKVFMLLRQVLYQPSSAATSGLCELLARNETDRMRHNFKNLVGLTASLGIVSAGIFVLCNSLFIQVWTNGKIVWPLANDLFLGAWIFVASIQTTHCSLVFINKQIGRMPYVLIAEGIAFVTLSLVLGYRWGIPGIAACSLLCLTLFSCQFGIRKSAKYFNAPLSEMVLEWIRPALNVAAILIVVFPAIWLATSTLPTLWRLVIHASAAGVIGGYLLIRVGLSPEMVKSIQQRLPLPAVQLLQLMKPTPVQTAK